MQVDKINTMAASLLDVNVSVTTPPLWRFGLLLPYQSSSPLLGMCRDLGEDARIPPYSPGNKGLSRLSGVTSSIAIWLRVPSPLCSRLDVCFKKFRKPSKM